MAWPLLPLLVTEVPLDEVPFARPQTKHCLLFARRHAGAAAGSGKSHRPELPWPPLQPSSAAAMAQSGSRIPRLLVPMGLRRHLQNGCDGGDRVEGQVSRLVLDAFPAGRCRSSVSLHRLLPRWRGVGAAFTCGADGKELGGPCCTAGPRRGQPCGARRADTGPYTGAMAATPASGRHVWDLAGPADGARLPPGRARGAPQDPRAGHGSHCPCSRGDCSRCLSA